MVFLVDHQAELFAAVDGHGPGALALGMFAADQVPLDEELAIDLLQLRQVDVEQFGLGGDGRGSARAGSSRSARGLAAWPG